MSKPRRQFADQLWKFRVYRFERLTEDVGYDLYDFIEFNLRKSGLDQILYDEIKGPLLTSMGKVTPYES